MQTTVDYAIFRIIQLKTYFTLIKNSIVQRIIIIGLIFLPLTNFSYAEEIQKQSFDFNKLVTNFYKDPRPERLVGFIDSFPDSLSWVAYPPIAGFYAVVFENNPKWIERLFPKRFNAKTATTIITALHLAGDLPISSDLNTKLMSAGIDPKLKSVFTGLPNHLEKIHIRTGTDLDILWGAAFASGSPRFVEMIIDFFAQTANRSEQIAIDTSRVVIAMTGGPEDVFKTLKDKYGAPLATEIVVAAAALWALESNAKQHAFVKETLEKYVEDHPGTYATKALRAVVLHNLSKRSLD